MEISKGQRFGRLTAVKRIENKKSGHSVWLCKCKCGNYAEVTTCHLKDGHTKSCGCLKNKYHAKNKRLLNIWHKMIDRCDNPNRKDSRYYHDKGVTYCKEWEAYGNFEKWAFSSGYAGNLTLDRIDSNGNYEPSNCQWITLTEQQRKKEGNIWLEYNGETKILADWAREYGINRATLKSRLDMGYTIEQALNKKPRINRVSVVVNYNGEEMNITQLSEKLNVSVSLISKDLKRGKTVEETIIHAEEVGGKNRLKNEPQLAIKNLED